MVNVKNDGVTLSYDDLGTGPALLLSHSWFCTRRQWPHAHEWAAAGYRVLNMDNRGRGSSGPCRDRYSIWQMAEDMKAVLDHAGVERAIIVGLSIGGFAAIRAALAFPTRVQGLVLADTGAGAAARTDRIKLATMGPIWRSPARAAVLPTIVAQLFGRTARTEQPELIRSWRATFLDQDPASMTAQARAIVTRDDVTERLGEIHTPVLVIVGDEDRNPGVPAARDLATKLPAASLTVLPRTGHLSAVEQPERFSEHLLSFVNRVTSF